MKVRGRPVKSQIRQNVVEILHELQEGYGYQISRIYNTIYPQVTQRSIYYHLHKGIKTNEIAVRKVEQERGDFSWGQSVEKTYYMLGAKANPKGDVRVRDFLKSFKSLKR